MNRNIIQLNMEVIASILLFLGVVGSLFMVHNERERQFWALSEKHEYMRKDIAKLQARNRKQDDKLEEIEGLIKSGAEGFESEYYFKRSKPNSSQ